MKVLVVVEDDADFRMLVKLTLAAEPLIEIDGEAATAEEALRLVEADSPDLVVLDHFIEGPVMGLDLAPMIKMVSPATRILLFTTHDLAVEASRQPAVDRYLRKHDISMLLPVVKEMLDL